MSEDGINGGPKPQEAKEKIVAPQPPIQQESANATTEREELRGDVSGQVAAATADSKSAQRAESKEVHEQVKIIICGPPHSGKSVFFATLKDHLPRSGTTLFRACPDGEGTWSQMADSEVASSIRKKGKFTGDFVDFAKDSINGDGNNRLLIDVGGLRTPENEEIFQQATHFVVLCRSDRPEEREAWEEFGQQQGLELLASLNSSLTGEEVLEPEVEDGVVRGTVVGLNRGDEVGSRVIEDLAHKILMLTPEELRKETIEMVDGISKIHIDALAQEVNVPYKERTITDRRTGEPKVIKNPHWTGQAVREAVSIVRELDPESPVWLDGGHPAFVYSALAYELGDREQLYVTDFKMTDGKREIPGLEAESQDESVNIAWETEERDDYTLIEVSFPAGGYFDMSQLANIVPPDVNREKGIAISGKLPFAIFCALVRHYRKDVPWISVFTPQQRKDAEMTTPAMYLGSDSGEQKVGEYHNCPPIQKESN